MFQNFKLFGSIAKTEDQEDGTIKVYGVASSGARDHAGEVVKPEAMKAALPDYSRFPALREMHEPKAAGRVIEASVDEDGFTNIVAHVVDPVAVQKVKAQVYPAFSIGGKVLERDPGDKSVISALRLVEISLVDSPCNPDAALTMWKAEQMSEYVPTGDEVVARAKKLAQAAGTKKFRDFLFEAREELVAEDLLEKGLTEATEAVVEIDGTTAGDGDDVSKVEDNGSGTGGRNSADAGTVVEAEIPSEESKEAAADAGSEAESAAEEQAQEGSADTASEGEEDKEAAAAPDPANALATALADALEKAKSKDEPYGDVEYADPGYQEDGKKRYPLDTEEHIRAAWNYVHQKKNADKYTADQLDKVKAKIIAAWKDKIDSDGPPAAEKMAPLADLSKTAAALRSITSQNPLLAKSLYTVGWLAQLLDQVVTIQSCSEFEEDYEGDDSKVPTMLADACRQLGDTLVAMAQEEVAEALQAIASDDAVVVEYVGDDEPVLLAQQIVDLTKADDGIMAKAGARNSKADKEHLQAAHDHLAKMGAACDPNNVPADGADKMAKLTEENESLRKTLTEAAPQVAELGDTITSLKAEIADLRKRFEDEPLPRKTAGPAVGVVAVAKGADSAGNSAVLQTPSEDDIVDAVAKLSEEERGLLMIKAAHRSPHLIAPARTSRAA